MTATYLVQDIETIPETEIQGMWEEECKEKEKDPAEEFPPIQFHKVVCIGVLALDSKLMPIDSGCVADGLQSGAEEKEMIEGWSKKASGEEYGIDRPLRLIDWHGRGFDVPVLQTRAFAHGIPMRWYFSRLPDFKGGISKYSKDYRDRYNGHHKDLADEWTNRGAFRRPHLANLAELIGLPGKVGIDGSKVHAAYKEGLYADIDIYCMQDVYQTAWVFQRYLYISGRIDLKSYQEAAEALLGHVNEVPGQLEFANSVNRDVLLLR
jgi:predicted PolB exonuclease-like 3'-5' exonuclease